MKEKFDQNSDANFLTAFERGIEVAKDIADLIQLEKKISEVIDLDFQLNKHIKRAILEVTEEPANLTLEGLCLDSFVFIDNLPSNLMTEYKKHADKLKGHVELFFDDIHNLNPDIAEVWSERALNGIEKILIEMRIITIKDLEKSNHTKLKIQHRKAYKTKGAIINEFSRTTILNTDDRWNEGNTVSTMIKEGYSLKEIANQNKLTHKILTQLIKNLSTGTYEGLYIDPEALDSVERIYRKHAMEVELLSTVPNIDITNSDFVAKFLEDYKTLSNLDQLREKYGLNKRQLDILIHQIQSPANIMTRTSNTKKRQLTIDMTMSHLMEGNISDYQAITKLKIPRAKLLQWKREWEDMYGKEL